MKNKILYFLKGLILGSAIILPGISFSLLALLLNCYEFIFYNLSIFLIHPFKVFKRLFPILLGIITSIIVLFLPLAFVLKNNPFLTICFFSGVLIKCIINILNNVTNFNFKTIFFYFLGLLFFYIFLLFKIDNDFTFEFENNINYIIELLLISLISSSCIISPGISLTFSLITIGFYQKCIDFMYLLLDLLINHTYINLKKYIITFLLLFLFFMIFFIIFSNLTSKLIQKFKSQTYLFFIGASTSNIFISIFNSNIELNYETNIDLCYNLFCCYILILLGYMLTLTLEKLYKRGDYKVRLDKFLSSSGNGTRKEVKQLIKDKRIYVNDMLVKAPSLIIDEYKDIIKIDNKIVEYHLYYYILLYKPKGYVSSTEVENNYPPVTDLVSEYDFAHLFPVGRLDVDTTGLLLLTNDGKLAHRLLSPKFHVDKKYIVKLDKTLDSNIIPKFESGIQIQDEFTLPCKMRIIDSNTAEVIIHEGKYHQIKRMFAYFGYKVIGLHRSEFSFLNLNNLNESEYRLLTNEEIEKLRLEGTKNN